MPLAPAGESSQVVMLMRVRGEARVGEGAGQAGDVQLQPGFKRFSEQVSGGGGGHQVSSLATYSPGTGVSIAPGISRTRGPG